MTSNKIVSDKNRIQKIYVFLQSLFLATVKSPILYFEFSFDSKLKVQVILEVFLQRVKRVEVQKIF